MILLIDVDSGLFLMAQLSNMLEICLVVCVLALVLYRFAQQDNFRLVIELVYTLDMAITSNGKVNLKS